MDENKNIHSLPVPLFGLLGSLGHVKHGWYHHFETGTLFWSLTRLFGFYHRIVSIINLRRDERVFLESDIESFIIRMRIVLNDIAFILRQLLPEQARGLKKPKGGTHPKNKEMSIFDLITYFNKIDHDFPELADALNKNQDWIFKLREQRDNIVHYKSKVIVFGKVPELSFAMLNADGPENTIPTEKGGRRVVTIPIFEFVNSQMMALNNFLHCDLYTAIKSRIDNERIEFKKSALTREYRALELPYLKKITESIHSNRLQGTQNNGRENLGANLQVQFRPPFCAPEAERWTWR